MIVHAALHHARALAQRTGHAELRGNRLADEGALVRQLVQELGQLLFDLEGNHRGLRRLTRHAILPRLLNYKYFTAFRRQSQAGCRAALTSASDRATRRPPGARPAENRARNPDSSPPASPWRRAAHKQAPRQPCNPSPPTPRNCRPAAERKPGTPSGRTSLRPR